jgi:CDP-diacylglycerol--glycerol-3-phosphate 3-phosphatidyltransferase
MFNPSNILSILRGPLALLFMIDNAFYRSLAIFLAMVTDGLDGYLARRWRMTSHLGTILDPLMDKFFVLFIVGVLIHENKMQFWQALAFISRDFAVVLFGIYLACKGAWSRFRFQSIWFGKISTSLQFLILLALTFHFSVPATVYICFIILGILSLYELYSIERHITPL